MWSEQLKLTGYHQHADRQRPHAGPAGIIIQMATGWLRRTLLLIAPASLLSGIGITATVVR